MITATSAVFPNNVVALLAARCNMVGVIDPETDLTQRIAIYQRPLRPTDANQAIGIAPMNMMPDDQTYETLGAGQTPGPSYPTMRRYWINVQGLVRHGDEIQGQAIHSVLAVAIRTVLDMDGPLRLGLAALTSDAGAGRTERFMRSGVRIQRYLATEVKGEFSYLSTTEWWIETSTS